MIFKLAEKDGKSVLTNSIAGAMNTAAASVTDMLKRLSEKQLIKYEKYRGVALTEEGNLVATALIRKHRLWEVFLVDKLGFAWDEVHDLAEQLEHVQGEMLVDRLDTFLGRPRFDPHGDPIPSAEGDVLVNGSQPLTAMQPQQAVRIVHLEDEPAVVYAQLVAEGFYPGMEAQILEMTPQRVRLWADGNEHILAPIVAANINVRPLEVALTAAVEPTLADLAPGEQGRVVRISARCRGAERRRFLDLGILPGTLIGAEMRSLSGDPTAYRIREALIALRREQAALIA